jgi:peptidoglycan hydrolase-like protein with peptidoglycan-binding domain
MSISPTMGVKVTFASQKALEQAKLHGLRLTSAYRSPALDKRVGGTGHGDHVQGEAYDFAGSYAAMEKFAQWAFSSGMYTQVIFKDKDYRTGRRILGHQNHVHIAWNGNQKSNEVQDRKIDDRSVAEGSKRSLVYAIQGMLATMYKDIKIDGHFGAETKKAVEHFQETMKLKVDGVVGENTWGALTGVFFSE